MAGHTFSLLRRGKWMALDPINAFWAGVFVVYIVQPVQFGDVFARWHPPGTMEYTLAYSLLAFGCVVLGYEAPWGVKFGQRTPRMPERLGSGRLMLTAGVLIGLGVVGYTYLIGTAASFSEWLETPRGGTDWKVVNGYIATLTTLLPLGVALLLFWVSFQRAPAWFSAIVWALAVLQASWVLYLGSRSQFILSVLTMLAAYYLPRRRNPPAWLLGVTFLVLMGAVAFLANYRENFMNLSFNLDQIDFEEAERRILPEFLGGDARLQKREVATGNDFNCVMSVIDLVPGDVDFNYGLCLMEFLTRPIPRDMWPDKVYPHYEAFTPIYERGGLSTWEIYTSQKVLLAGPAFTFVGHWYAVGGPVALIVAGLLTGSFFRLIRAIYERRRGSQGDTLLYYMLMPIGFGEAAATPLFWIFQAPVLIVGIGILFFCRKKTSQETGQQRAPWALDEVRASRGLEADTVVNRRYSAGREVHSA
jgi:hypothetical protein